MSDSKQNWTRDATVVTRPCSARPLILNLGDERQDFRADHRRRVAKWNKAKKKTQPTNQRQRNSEADAAKTAPPRYSSARRGVANVGRCVRRSSFSSSSPPFFPPVSSRDDRLGESVSVRALVAWFMADLGVLWLGLGLGLAVLARLCFRLASRCIRPGDAGFRLAIDCEWIDLDRTQIRWLRNDSKRRNAFCANACVETRSVTSEPGALWLVVARMVANQRPVRLAGSRLELGHKSAQAQNLPSTQLPDQCVVALIRLCVDSCKKGSSQVKWVQLRVYQELRMPIGDRWFILWFFFRFCRSILVDGSAQRDPDAEEPPARSLEPTAQWMWVLSIFYFVCLYLDCWCRKNNIFERSAVFHCGRSYFDQYRAVSGAPQRETTPTNKNWPFLGGQK